jgi:hypothetical protein
MLPGHEKLQVFVSSSIRECPSERGFARNAIKSLNLGPILFEHVGARSCSSREWYLAGVERSQIFVGIYKNSYGFVADGMIISGIEDEYPWPLRSPSPPLPLADAPRDIIRDPASAGRRQG